MSGCGRLTLLYCDELEETRVKMSVAARNPFHLRILVILIIASSVICECLVSQTSAQNRRHQSTQRKGDTSGSPLPADPRIHTECRIGSANAG